VTTDLAVRLAAGFRDARSRLDKDAAYMEKLTLATPLIRPSPQSRLLYAISVSRRQLDALEWIAELHHDDRGYCWNCYHSDWPCPTFDLVAAGLGIDL
jgi:hypothetical protein